MKTKKIQFICAIAAIFTFFTLCTSAKAQTHRSEAEKKAIVWNVHDKELKWGPCPAFMPKGCSIAVLHGNPKQPNADILFKLQGNTKVPRHWHHSPERMVLISGKMRVKYDGQDAELMNAGNYAYGPAMLPHSALCISDEPCILFIAFEDPIDAIPASEGYE